MATALVDIANNAGFKVSGFGDQLGGDGQVTAAQLTADADIVSIAINDKYPICRQKTQKDLLAKRCPFPEGLKFADLGLDLKQYDISIESITVSSTVVTITTDEVHGRSTGDTVFLTGILQDADETIDDIEGTLITSLNGTTVTVTVTTTTAFTIDTAGVDATWAHEADTGIISYVPDIGPYQYAFLLPSDFFDIFRQTDEITANVKKEYQHRVILNRDGDGYILLTNHLTNAAGNSAYIEYIIDQQTFALFSPAYEECIAVLLAAELCPIVGKNMEFRRGLLAEYIEKTVPEAQRDNQSKQNNRSKFVPDFSGGRSGQYVPGVNYGLGTYKTADGSRKQIHP